MQCLARERYTNNNERIKESTKNQLNNLHGNEEAYNTNRIKNNKTHTPKRRNEFKRK